MIKIILVSFVLMSGFFMISTASATAITTGAGDYHGQIIIQSGEAVAWYKPTEQWLSIDDFWKNWTDSRGGMTWGRSEMYPPYDQVKEQDTFLVEINGGTCLMEFWHSRWRRANDVRRWDDGFNDYSACPHVFD